jgi:hypothetical protein
MRAPLAIAAAAIALAGCGKDEAASNGTAVQEDAQEIIAANDITAIDAVTGADANMAEDVEFTVPELNNDTAANSDDQAGSNTSD